MKLTRLLNVILLAGCSGSIEPVPLALNEEICSHCRMAVSQLEFAGEIVTPAGRVYYFDDIGCLTRWLGENDSPGGSAFFVIDYQTGDWLSAPSSYYVESSRLPTPMGYGVAASPSLAEAQQLAAQWEGQALSWCQLWGEDDSPP